MPLFDEDIFDSDLFDTGGAGAASTTVDPIYQSRWLLVLDIGGRIHRYSDLAGEVHGDLYRQGIAGVSLGEAGLDLENRTATLADAAVDLVPEPYDLDPRRDLRRALATLSLLVDGVIVAAVKGPVSEVRIGRSWITDQHGEVHSFRIVEEFTRNPDFPPRTADSERFPEKRRVPASEGQVLTQVFGDAFVVPMFPLTEEPETGQRYLICGHSLRGGVPAPHAGFPWDTFPSRAELKGNEVVGIWVHTNQGIRDSFRNSELNEGWVKTGTATEGTTGVVITAGSTLHWNQWRNQKPFSLAVSVENAGAGSASGRGFDIRWGWRDVDNYLAATFNVSANTVRITVVRAGIVEWGSETWQPPTALVNTLTEYRLAIDSGGQVSVGVGDQRNSFEGTPVGIHTGHIMFASNVEDQRFTSFRMPQQRPVGITLGKLNAGIQTFDDALGDAYVAEEYEEEVSDTLYAQFHEAQNVVSAGDLYETLILKYSGYKQREVDLPSLGRAKTALPLRVGGYYTQQAKIFDIIAQRIAPQFLAWVVQEAGQIRILTVDPSAQPVQHLRLHRDLLEMTEQIAVMPSRTHFQVKFRYRENLVTGADFARKETLGPDDLPTLRAHENRLPGPVEYPTIELVDVVHVATANQILHRYASIYWKAEEVTYLRRTVTDPHPVGTVVEITDEPNGYERQRAIVVSRRYESPDFMVERYRTLHPLEDAVVLGTPVTVATESLVLRELFEDW